MATEDELFAVSRRIRDAVHKAGGYKRVSERCGVPRGTIGNMARGTNRSSFDSVAAVAQACGISLDWLVTGGGDPEVTRAPDNREPITPANDDGDAFERGAVVDQIPVDRRDEMLEAILEMAFNVEQQDEIGPWVRGFFQALASGV